MGQERSIRRNLEYIGMKKEINTRITNWRNYFRITYFGYMEKMAKRSKILTGYISEK